MDQPDHHRIKIHLTFDFEISGAFDSGSDIEWEVYRTIRNHIQNCGNTDDFYHPENMKVDFTETET